MTNYHSADPLRAQSWACADVLWRQADVGPTDVDVAQFYDAFTPMVVLALEGYGFCGRGEGAAFTEDGRIAWPDGKLPINTSGGGLSEAYVHGFNLVLEGVRQVRGNIDLSGPRCAVLAGDERRRCADQPLLLKR